MVANDQPDARADVARDRLPKPSGSWRWSKALAVAVLLSAVAVVVPGATAGVRAWTDPNATELLGNGSFESGGAGLSPWTFRHDVDATLAASSTDVYDGKRMATVTIDAASAQPWLVQLRQEHLELRAGTVYTMSVVARASTTRVINLRLQSSVAPYATYASVDAQVTPFWQRLDLVFTPTTDLTGVFAGFNLGQDVGEVDLDAASVLASHNLVADGGFEADAPPLGPWKARNDAGARFTRDTVDRFDGTAAARIDVAAVDGSAWHAQLRQPVGPLWTRATYRVGFAVRASQPRLLNVRLQGGDAPNPTLVERNVAATTSWTRVMFDWAPTTTTTNPFLGFNLGQDTGTIWLDDVTLIQTGGPVAPCVDGVPDHVTALTSLTLPTTTVRAGDVLDAHYSFIHVETRPGATFNYRTPSGRLVGLDLNIYDQDEPSGITIPADWVPGRYRLESIDDFALGQSTQYRNGDLVGMPYSLTTPIPEYPVCGRSPLNLAAYDLQLIR